MVAFVRSDHFYPEAPDFAWVHARVQKALQPADNGSHADHNDGGRNLDGSGGGGGSGGGDGAAVQVQDSCGYHPVG